MTRPASPRVLVVTAVAAEGDAVTAGVTAAHHGTGGPPPTVEVRSCGVGPAAAAAATAGALTAAAWDDRPYGLVVSAGIGGGFAPLAPPGSSVVASRLVAADLGSAAPDGFTDVAELGFGTVEYVPPPELARTVAEATGALLAPVLTVSTATGTAERAAELLARYPDAGAEAMEGFGVAEAAARAGVPVLELRTVSNPVGPRDRAAWRIPDALRALTVAVTAAVPVLVSGTAAPSRVAPAVTTPPAPGGPASAPPGTEPPPGSEPQPGTEPPPGSGEPGPGEPASGPGAAGGPPTVPPPVSDPHHRPHPSGGTGRG